MFYDTICLVGFDYKWLWAHTHSYRFAEDALMCTYIKISFVSITFSLLLYGIPVSLFCALPPFHCTKNSYTFTSHKAKNINKWDKLITKPIEHRSYARMFTIYLFSNLKIVAHNYRSSSSTELFRSEYICILYVLGGGGGVSCSRLHHNPKNMRTEFMYIHTCERPHARTHSHIHECIHKI